MQLLEIDSNCNYDLKKSPNSFYQDRGGSGNSGTINYGFVFISECSQQQQKQQHQQQDDQQQDDATDGSSFRLSAASISDDLVVSSAASSRFSYTQSSFFDHLIDVASRRYNRSFFGSQIFRTVFFRLVAVLVVVFVALS